jgi:predicted amidohydrolase
LGKKTPDLWEGSPAVVKVAMCQVFTEEWAVEDNLARTLDALREAAERGAELAITPECVISGYGFEKPEQRGRVHELAETADSPRLARVRETARALGMDVGLGFAERDGDLVHNSAAVISRKGELLDLYRKVHCRHFESIWHWGWFTPGERFLAVERPCSQGAYNLGVMICFDREVTETVRCLRALGSHLIACPLACDTEDAAHHGNYAENEMVTRVRAAENEVFIAVVNHAGRYNGGSFAVGPGGELLHQMGPEAGVVVLDIPVGAVRDGFHTKPLGWMGWGYRRPEVYDHYLQGRKPLTTKSTKGTKRGKSKAKGKR